MNDWDREPWQDQVDQINCKFCNEDSDYDFCSYSCMRAYWSEID